MLSDAQRNELQTVVSTMQVIVGALALGVMNFLLVVVLFDIGGNRQAADPPTLSFAAACVAVVAIVAAYLMPWYLAGPMRRTIVKNEVGSGETTTIRKLARMYQTLLIIRCAVLEGGAFFCCVSFMLEHHIVALIAAVVLLTVLLMQFPTRHRAEAWLEQELRVATQLQQF
jgi:hypothetical protein